MSIKGPSSVMFTPFSTSEGYVLGHVCVHYFSSTQKSGMLVDAGEKNAYLHFP